MRSARRLVFALLAAALPAGFAAGQEPARLVLEFRGAELAQVVRSIAQDTGRGFVFDERLQGRVTIAVPDGVTHDEAIEVLHAALRLRGFVALPAPGGVSRILPLADSAGSAPLRGAPDAAREGAITTLVRLRHADAAVVAGTIEPLVGTNGSAIVVESSNSIVLASSESALRRLLDIVHALDRREPVELSVLRLRWRGAEEVAELVNGVFRVGEPGGAEIEIVSDARTNALVVEASPEELAEVRAFVRGIDLPGAGGGNVHVVRVRNVDAEDLAERLTEVARPTRAAGRASRDDEEDGALPLEEGDWSIAVDRPTRSLLVVADASTFAALAELIAELDVTPPVVSVEVQVVEIDSTDSLDVAIDALVLVSEPKGADDTVALVQTVTSGTRVLSGPEVVEDGGLLRFAQQPLRLLGLDAAGDEVEVGTVPDDTAAILARQRRVDSRLLLRPHLLVASGEEQEIFAGANIPIPVAGSTGAAGGDVAGTDGAGSQLVDPLTLRTNIERQDVGVRLRVKPTLGAEGGLRLDLEVEATRVGESTLGDVEEVGPTLLSRELTTRLHLAEDEVAILGGRGAPSRRLVESGVPFLMDVPFFGQLFRSTREEQVLSHMVVAVQARVLRSPDDLALDSIRRRLAFERSREGLRPLEAETDAPWAVLVATRAARGEAEAVAAQLGAAGGELRVVGWELGGQPRFDVFVTGFAEFADACAVARQLARDGWLPEVVALPGSARGSGLRPASSARGGAKP
jgi:general secretion pathway protein D